MNYEDNQFKVSFDIKGRTIESPFTEGNFREEGTKVVLCLIKENTIELTDAEKVIIANATTPLRSISYE